MATSSRWFRADYVAPEALEDELSGHLWAGGTGGVQVLAHAPGQVRLEAYFPTPEAPVLPGADLVGVTEVPNADWLAVWRALAEPFPVGETLWFDPREPEEGENPFPSPENSSPNPSPGDLGRGTGLRKPLSSFAGEGLGRGSGSALAGRQVFRIPARAAFGTGSHESTGLALQLLERTDVTGHRVIDVGTGTGVLAIVALARGARSAVAFDIDFDSPFHARDNVRLNLPSGPTPTLYAGTLEALGPAAAGRFTVALVNIIPEVFIPELPRLVPVLAPGAQAIFSGILIERAQDVEQALRAAGFDHFTTVTSGEWIAFRGVRVR